MTRRVNEQNIINFSKGIITEGNDLAYPDAAVKEMKNFVLLKNGSIERRLGLQYEDGSSTVNVSPVFPPSTALDQDKMAYKVYHWENVNNDTDINIAVIQIGPYLYFFYTKNGAITDSVAANTLTLPLFEKEKGSYTTCDFSSDGTYLFVVNRYSPTFYVTFEEPTIPYNQGTVTRNDYNIYIRDFEYLKQADQDSSETNYDFDYRPNTLSYAHWYNLTNAGWPLSMDVSKESASTKGYYENLDPIEYTFTTQSIYPSLSDVMDQFRGKVADIEKELNAYNPWSLKSWQTDAAHSLTNTPAPLGKNIVNLFNFTRKIGATTVQTDSIQSYFSCTAFYSGRVFYSGATGRDRLDSKIFFSQIITNNNKDEVVGKCYQEADPTDPNDPSIVATDGGYISIPSSGKIHRLIPSGLSLIVVADRGIWQIIGSDNKLFSPNNYIIRKVSSIGCNAPDSITDIEGIVYYWGKSAVYRLVENDVSSLLSSQDITTNTIRTVFLDINKINRDNCTVVPDTENKSILWLYSTASDYNGSSQKYFYDAALVFDVELNAWYRYEFDSSSFIYVTSGFPIEQGSIIDTTDYIAVGADQVVVDTNDVVLQSTIQRSSNFSVKFLTVYRNVGSTYTFGISEFTDTTFEDFGQPFESSIETGCLSDNTITRNKGITKVSTFFEKTEDGFVADGAEFVFTNPSGCTLSYSWDWVGCSPQSDNYTGNIAAYRLKNNYIPSGDADTFDYKREIIVNKTLIRGRGKALSLRFKSEDNKDMKLLGFTLNWVINQRP